MLNHSIISRQKEILADDELMRQLVITLAEKFPQVILEASKMTQADWVSKAHALVCGLELVAFEMAMSEEKAKTYFTSIVPNNVSKLMIRGRA